MTEFDKDIREKKQIGYSARRKVVGGGRRGWCGSAGAGRW